MSRRGPLLKKRKKIHARGDRDHDSILRRIAQILQIGGPKPKREDPALYRMIRKKTKAVWEGRLSRRYLIFRGGQRSQRRYSMDRAYTREMLQYQKPGKSGGESLQLNSKEEKKADDS